MSRLAELEDDGIAAELKRLQVEDPSLFEQFQALTAAARRVEEAQAALQDPALQSKIKTAAQSPRVVHVAETLQQLSGRQSLPILGGLGAVSPALAEAIKLAMFSFDDLVYADSKGLQALLSRADKKTLRYAMKALDEEVADALYDQMSSRAAAQMREDIEYMGRVRRGDVMDARRRLTDLARQMMKAGELIVIKPDDEDDWVR